MKKIIKKRVLAGSVAAAMTTALVGTCGYQSTLQANAKEKDATAEAESQEQSREAETEKLEETLQGMIKTSDASDDGTFSKEESVYIKADASGKVKSTTVTEWLKHPGSETVSDYTDLNDVKNIKGDERFTQDGGEISWEAEGKDIYYQGTTDKEAPVGVEITYTLDGKEISPEELEGKDGHLDITFRYLNRSVETVETNGETVEMYTPFTMVTAMMLPVDEYQNVSVDHGKIISDAKHDIVVGVGFLGMAENLALEDQDLDLTDSVTVSADVTDFEIHPSLTIASTEILDQFDLTDAQDFDSLEDSIHKLEDAADELTKGSSDASDGAKALLDGSNTLSDGAKTLSEGIHTLDAKSGDLIRGVNQLTEGVAAYTDGVDALAQGSTALAEGASGVNDGAGQIRDGVQTAKAGADQLMAGYDDPAAGAVVAAEGIAGGLGQLSQALGEETQVELSEEQVDGIHQLAAGMAQRAVEVIPEEVFAQMGMTKEAYVTRLADGYAQILLPQVTAAVNEAAAAVKGQVKGNVDQIEAVSRALALGVGQLRDGTAALQGGLAALDQGSAALAAGAGQLLEGASELAAGAGTLQSNSPALRAGTGQLSDGGAQLTAGVSELTKGADRLSGGAQELLEGAGKLSDGNQKLSDGMAEFQREGIEKLVQVFDGDIKDVTSRIETMIDLGRDYRSFTGIKDGVEGTTKFIIECE